MYAQCVQVECDVGAPQVNYRESISKIADIKYTHKKQSGGSGQFAEVAIKFEPGEPGTGFEFRSEIKGGTVPKEYIPGVTKVTLLASLLLCCHPILAPRLKYTSSLPMQAVEPGITESGKCHTLPRFVAARHLCQTRIARAHSRAAMFGRRLLISE